MRRLFAMIFIMSFLTILLSSCLTTKERVAMEEFKKQLEVAPAELSESGPLTSTAMAQALSMTAKAEKTAGPIEKKVAVKPTEITKQQEPVIIQTPVKIKEKETTTKNKTNWLAAVLLFLLGMGLIILIVFLMKKRKETITEEDKTEFKEEKFPHIKEPEVQAVKEQENIFEEKTAREIEKQEPTTPEPEQIPEQEAAQPTEKFEEEIGEEGPVINKPGETAFIPERPADALPKDIAGSGKARISPVQLKAGSAGNTIHIIYNVGEDSPEFRILKITIPEGWPIPSTVAQDDGYITVEVKGGKLISKAAEGRVITVTVYGLAAVTGEIIVAYGDKGEGGRGVTIPDIAGVASFIVETGVEASKEIKSLEDTPSVEIIP